MQKMENIQICGNRENICLLFYFLLDIWLKIWVHYMLYVNNSLKTLRREMEVYQILIYYVKYKS
jgi:hypothetical protein